MSDFLSVAVTITLTLYAIAFVLLAWRMWTGPSAQDRVLALDCMYLVGMLTALVVGMRYTSNMFFEAALLIALFGFVGTAALAKFLLRGEVIE